MIIRIVAILHNKQPDIGCVEERSASILTDALGKLNTSYAAVGMYGA
jgi:hypothetical protein